MEMIFQKSWVRYQPNPTMISMNKLQPEEVKKFFIVVLLAVVLFCAVVMIRLLRAPENAIPKDQDSKAVQLEPPAPTDIPLAIPAGKMMISLHDSTQILLNDIKTSAQLNVGETIVTAIRINPGRGESISGADAIVRFDPAKLTVVEPIKTDFDFANYPRKSVDAKSGTVKITGYGIDCDPCSGLLAAITFKAIAQGQTSIDLDYLPGSTNLSTIAQKGTGRNILGRVEGATVTISNF